MFRYGVQISVDEVSERTPVILRGEFEKSARIAHEIGYDGIELFMHSPKEKDPYYFKEVADKFNLDITCICTGMEYARFGLCLTSDDAEIRKKAVEKLKEHIDFASVINSFICIGTLRGQITELAQIQTFYKRFEEALIELSRYAKEKNVQLLVEDNPQYVSNFLNSADEVGAFIKKLKLDNVNMHLDTHCMNMEDRSMTTPLIEYKDILKYLHFSDANRGYPGSCNINFLEIMKTLIRTNYQGYITLECQPYPTEYECAKRGLEYVKALEEVARIESLVLKYSLYK